MVVELNSTNLLVQAANRANTAAQPENSPVQMQTSEANPVKDTFEYADKHLSKRNKISIAAGLIGVCAAIYGLAVHGINRISPKKLQRMLNDIYMRDDITVDEAKNIAKHFKELGKIKDKEEYADKAFEYVKKLFGLGDKPIEFKAVKTDKKSIGGCHIDNSEINIKYDNKTTNKELLALIHHELRHAKQHWLSFNQYPEYAREMMIKPTFKDHISEDSEIAKYVDGLIDKGITSVNELLKHVSEKFGYMIDERINEYFGKLSPDNVPEKYKEFAQKCMENEKNYIKMEENDKAYRQQFVEADAYNIQKQILKIMDWY